MCQIWCIFKTKWPIYFSLKMRCSEAKVLRSRILRADFLLVAIFLLLLFAGVFWFAPPDCDCGLAVGFGIFLRWVPEEFPFGTDVAEVFGPLLFADDVSCSDSDEALKK